MEHNRPRAIFSKKNNSVSYEFVNKNPLYGNSMFFAKGLRCTQGNIPRRSGSKSVICLIAGSSSLSASFRSVSREDEKRQVGVGGWGGESAGEDSSQGNTQETRTHTR